MGRTLSTLTIFYLGRMASTCRVHQGLRMGPPTCDTSDRRQEHLDQPVSEFWYRTSPLIRASDRLESCRLGRFSQRQERLPQTVTKSRRARGQAQVVPVASGTTTTMSSGLASSTTLDRAALTPKGTKSRWYWPVGATAISPPSKETRSASCQLVGAWASCQLFCVPLIGFECLIRVSRRGFHR